MVGTWTFDHTTNVITVTGGTAVAPAGFVDAWNADKAGTLENVHARAITGADANPVAVDHALRPTDYYVLGLADVYITVTNFTVDSTIHIVGTEQYGAAQTEDIAITANGTYNTTKYWRTITTTQVTVFGGNFTYTLTQGQWGVVSKQGTTEYQFDCDMYIGTGSTTYFTDTNKCVSFTTGTDGTVMMFPNAVVTFGVLDDAATKSTSRGCTFINAAAGTAQQQLFMTVYWVGTPFAILNCYSCTFTALTQIIDIYLRTGSQMYNCRGTNRTYFIMLNNVNVYNTELDQGGSYGWIPQSSTLTLDKLSIFYATNAVFCQGTYDAIITNLYARKCSRAVQFWLYTNSKLYLVNADLDTWAMGFDVNSASSTLYRQYTFDLQVKDKDNVAINAATVTLKDKDGNVVFTVNTAADGTIAQQTVSRGYYNQANGNTLQEYSPHTLTITKADYQTYTHIFTLDEKIDWRVTLFKARPVLSSLGSLAVNLKPADPENMMIMTL